MERQPQIPFGFAQGRLSISFATNFAANSAHRMTAKNYDSEF